MANRTYLVRVDGLPCYKDDIQEEQYLCAASYCIPVFWNMLFGRNSVVESRELSDEEEPIPYPVLSAPAEDALCLAESRWPAVQNAIGQAYEPLFRTFCKFIQTIPGQFIQCETLELWWMSEPDREAFLSDLIAPFSAFDAPLYDPKRIPGLPPQVSKPWADLLCRSQAIVGNRIKPCTPESLCGYACSGSLPWGSDRL